VRACNDLVLNGFRAKKMLFAQCFNADIFTKNDF